LLLQIENQCNPKNEFLWSTAATVFEANKFAEFVLCYISNALQELKAFETHIDNKHVVLYEAFEAPPLLQHKMFANFLFSVNDFMQHQELEITKRSPSEILWIA
jgi:hypothetical protein